MFAGLLGEGLTMAGQRATDRPHRLSVDLLAEARHQGVVGLDGRLGITQARESAREVAEVVVLGAVEVLCDRAHEAQQRANLLAALAHLVYGFVRVLVGFGDRGEGGVDPLAGDPPQADLDRLAGLELIGHGGAPVRYRVPRRQQAPCLRARLGAHRGRYGSAGWRIEPGARSGPGHFPRSPIEMPRAFGGRTAAVRCWPRPAAGSSS